MGNTVDAVTSATASTHGTRTGKWNCTGLITSRCRRAYDQRRVTERNGLGTVMTR
jgi:hypothetical protein